jgi:hypothetical protein
MRPHLLAVVALVALPAACASTPVAPTAPLAAAGATNVAPSPPALAHPPAPLKEALDAAVKAVAAGDSAAADRHIASAAAAAGDNAHFIYLVARARALHYVYAGDLDRAAAAFIEVIPTLARHPELIDEFWSHNAMMMIREAQGDPASALAENDQATLCAERGIWMTPAERATLAFQKDRWHRAYLTRMLAESRAGSAKQALIAYAQAALDEYRPRGFPDSVAVLEAYFAALDGKPEQALAAAKRVDPAQDDDIEDLYLVVVGLEVGGDRAAADAVQRQMRRPGEAHIARAIMLRWLDLDAKNESSGGFTPWHAKGH